MGGTGKSPHTEYLLQHLLPHYSTATLSRGYGRKTHGFLVVEQQHTAREAGDEPLVYKYKFPTATVTVSEDRVVAIPQILQHTTNTQVVLLDDAFQHRAIKPGLSVLLTSYDNLFCNDHTFPLGWLRESKSNYHRADIIVVTKCPHHLTQPERNSIIAQISPYAYQHIYFSSLNYGSIYNLFNNQIRIAPDKGRNALLVCGIADFTPLKNYLSEHFAQVFLRNFGDHHQFDEIDLDSIRQTLNNVGRENTTIVTTEKDAVRLMPFAGWFSENKIEIFVQPVQVAFLQEDGTGFMKDIHHYINTTISQSQPA